MSKFKDSNKRLQGQHSDYVKKKTCKQAATIDSGSSAFLQFDNNRPTGFDKLHVVSSDMCCFPGTVLKHNLL